jgi:glutaredoxin
MNSELYTFYLVPTNKDPFTLYTSQSCKYCIDTLNLLLNTIDNDTNKPVLFVNYDYDSILGNEKLKNKLIVNNNHYTKPLIFYYGTFLGGYSELTDFLKNNKSYTINKKFKTKK